MNIKKVLKLLLLLCIPPICYFLSLSLTGYIFGETFYTSLFFQFISPILIAVYSSLKFGKTHFSKIIISSLCVIVSIIIFQILPLPNQIYTKPFLFRSLNKFDYNELEMFRKIIETKFDSETLKIENTYYNLLDNKNDDKSKKKMIKLNKEIKSEIGENTLINDNNKDFFWSAFNYYVPECEQSEYIKRNFTSIGLKIRDKKITSIYFIVNKNLWYIAYRNDMSSNPNEIFPNYYGGKR